MGSKTKPMETQQQQRLQFVPLSTPFSFDNQMQNQKSQSMDEISSPVSSNLPQKGNTDTNTILQAISAGNARLEKQLVDIREDLKSAAAERNQLRQQVGQLKDENNELRSRVKNLEDNQSNLDSALRRKNIILGGLVCRDNESAESRKDVISKLFSDYLNINNCKIDKTYRLHRAMVQPKPIVVKFETESARDEVLNRSKVKRSELGNVWLKPDLSKKERETRKLLAPFYQEAVDDRRNTVVKVVKDFLLVDNVRWNYDPNTETMVKKE